MMSMGQATAQSLQAMQRSYENLNMPRKRFAGSSRSSGYRIVTFGLNSSLSVVFSPSKRSSRRKRSVHFVFGYSTCMSDHLRLRPEQKEERENDDRRTGDGENDLAGAAWSREHHHRRHRDVGQRQRNHRSEERRVGKEGRHGLT